jgi:RND family efflux transporter MFP subunit
MKRAVIASLLDLAVLAGCSGGAKSTKTTSAESAALLAAADVGRVVTTDLAAGVPVSGTLTPSVDVTISSPMAEIVDVLVKEGQPVAKGQVLARFHAGAVDAAARSAEARLKMAKADYDRNQNLYQEGAVSKHDLEAAEAAYHEAQAAEAAAGRNAQDATVRAPIGGVISVKSVETGARPGEGDPLFELVNTSELEFEATIPSEFVPQIAVGAPVQLSVTGYPAGGIRGRVARINAAVDPATRQVKVYVRVPNPGGKLVGGLFASGTIVTQEAHGTIAAPAAAVRTEGGQQFAMVVENGKLARREVRAGLQDPGRDLVQIVSGLSAGDVVVTGPIEGLIPGRAVQIGKAS